MMSWQWYEQGYDDDDWDDDDPDRPCSFCGEQDCDKSGYNCPDEHYENYNLRGYEGAENAFDAAEAASDG